MPPRKSNSNPKQASDASVRRVSRAKWPPRHRFSLAERRRIGAVCNDLLRERFGPVKCPLFYDKPHQLAVAVILSAQCTDEQVNKVTPELFRRFPEVADLAQAPILEIEKLIRSTGFFHNKAKNIKGFAERLLSEHNGVIPRTLEELTKLPGVGRKTANVVLQELYGIPSGVVVDTHVSRISRVLGLTTQTDPVKIERDLMQVLAEPAWIDFSLYLIFLGRSHCTARIRTCTGCPVRAHCASADR